MFLIRNRNHRMVGFTERIETIKHTGMVAFSIEQLTITYKYTKTQSSMKHLIFIAIFVLTVSGLSAQTVADIIETRKPCGTI